MISWYLTTPEIETAIYTVGNFNRISDIDAKELRNFKGRRLSCLLEHFLKKFSIEKVKVERIADCHVAMAKENLVADKNV